MKTGLAQKYVEPEDHDMVPTENPELATQVAELRANVQHVQADVIDIKADQRDLKKHIDARFARVDQQFDEIKDSLASAKLWAFGLYVALGSTLLYVIARSAKWL